MQFRITVRELAETQSALQASEERFAAFMDQSPAVAFMQDTVGHVLYVNHSAERLWGVTATEVLGKTGLELWSDPGSGNSTCIEDVIVPDGGTRSFLSHRFPFDNGTKGWVYGTMAIDITEQKQLERDLREMNVALVEQTRIAQQANRLKSEFLANMSH